MFLKKILGMDIGTKNIKLVLLQGTNKNIKLMKAITIPTPTGCVEDGDITDIKLLAGSIATILNQEGIKAHEIAITFTSSQTIIRELRLPLINEDEIAAAAEFQLAQSFPGIGETHTISYKLYETNNNEKKGIVSFAPNKILNKYIALGQELKIPVRYIDVAANAAAKAFNTLVDEQQKQENVILMDIGYNNSQLHLISKGNRLLLSRIIDGGSKAVDIMISGSLGISLEEAENIKMKNLNNSNLSDDEYQAFTRLGLIAIEEQLRQTFDFFSYNKFEGRINAIFLIGQGSKAIGLKDYLSDVFGITVEYLKINMEKSSVKLGEQEQNTYINAIGAAIREDQSRRNK